MSAGWSRTQLLTHLSSQALTAVQLLWYMRRYQWLSLKMKALSCTWNVRVNLPSNVASYPVKAKYSSTNHLPDRRHTSSLLQTIFIIWYVNIQSVFNTRIRRLSKFGSVLHWAARYEFVVEWNRVGVEIGSASRFRQLYPWNIPERVCMLCWREK